jgi:hypothetical protein
MVIRKPIDMPPKVARGLVNAMNDYFAEANPTKRDAIASPQLSVLGQHQGPREKRLRLDDAKEMFEQMKDQA